MAFLFLSSESLRRTFSKLHWAFSFRQPCLPSPLLLFITDCLYSLLVSLLLLLCSTFPDCVQGCSWCRLFLPLGAFVVFPPPPPSLRTFTILFTLFFSPRVSRDFVFPPGVVARRKGTHKLTELKVIASLFRFLPILELPVLGAC